MSIAQYESNSPLLVAPLSNFRSNDLALAGGKGASLGELSQAGFDVPAGFIISTAAYDAFTKENNLQARLVGLLTSLDLNNTERIMKVSKQIQNLFLESAIPKELTDEILRAYHQLEADAVAVRSSATAEDLPEAAFAGQQETFLNIVDEQALLEAVRACWASLWSERAMLYRTKQNIDQNTVKLAVVVQTMVSADVAGVMFTANPVSGRRDEMIIDANPGLGEAVVSGLVTPDHFLADKHSGRIKEQRLGRKEVVIRSKPGGGTEAVNPPAEATNVQSLPLHAVHQLLQLGIEIERHYGAPQDIEWAWVKDSSKTATFFILQSRPMTALPEPLTVSAPMRLVVPMLAEMWLTRPYPLDMTTFTGAVERAIGNLLVAMIGKSAPNPDASFLEEDGVVVEFKPPQVRSSPSMLFTPWITMWRTRHYDPSRWESDPLLGEFIKKARALEQQELGSLTWEQNIEVIRESLALIPRAMELRERYVPHALLGLVQLWLLLVIARRSRYFGTLVSGVNTKTTETNLALEDLANQVRADAILRDLFRNSETNKLQSALNKSQTGRDFLERFQWFLDQYGHRETALTISQPAWKDEPNNVLSIVKVLAESEPKQPESYHAWQQTRDDLLANSVLGSKLLRAAFLKSLTNARFLFQIREDTHFYVTLLQPIIRHAALELGKRLVETGILDKLEDVFHLKLAELERLGKPWPPTEQTIREIRALVAHRKNIRDRLANKPMVDPRLLMNTSSYTDKDILLGGSSGSPGIASGPVRVVHDVSEFGKLRKGDVLVAPATNPAWTPLFQRAVAVVVDTGGSASHAAIVAREYGVPAVMGTLDGTKKLVDGQWIEVDGSRGLVLKTEEQK